MQSKMTKAAGRKRLKEIMNKASRLFLVGYISSKDLETFDRICRMREKQLK